MAVPKLVRALSIATLVVASSACALPRQGSGPEPPETGTGTGTGRTVRITTAPPTPVRDVVVALQVSHQDDTGPPGWHEWAIAGDVALRVLDRLRFAPTVLAWDLAGPLTGSNRYTPVPTNTPSFDSELAFAAQSDPDVFVALHTDNGHPSGVSAVVLPGDTRSHDLAARLLKSLSDATGLPNHGVQHV